MPKPKKGRTIRRRPLSQGQLERFCLDWNTLYPAGTPGRYHPVIGEPEYRATETTGPAFILSGHTAVVNVQGVAGCVALEACKPVEPKP